MVTQRGGQRLHISASIEPELPNGFLSRVFPEQSIGGERIYHEDLSWVGAALASFGIVYNTDILEMLGLPHPQTWSDLSNGRYLNWVALADPAHSGSIAATYNVILRRLGWTEGWAQLHRIFVNARYFSASAPNVPIDVVAAGEAAVGMCIDFDGRFRLAPVVRAVSVMLIRRL